MDDEEIKTEIERLQNLLGTDAEKEHNKLVYKMKKLDRLIKQEEEIDIDWGKNGFIVGGNLVYRGTLLDKDTDELKHMGVKLDPKDVKYSIIALVLQRRQWHRKAVQ